MNISRIRRVLPAFTLAETVIAMAVVGLLLTTFMGVFLPSRKSIQSSLSMQEADRLSTALTTELSTLRPTEKQKYKTAFDKAFEWMQKTRLADQTILIYNYRGDLTRGQRSDGSLQPYTKDSAVPGESTLVVPSVILASDQRQRLEQDSKALVGPVFLVKMTQLVWDSQGTRASSTQYGASGGKYVLARKPGVISNPYSEGQVCSNPNNYVYNPNNKQEIPWGAEVLFNAEFYQLPVVQPQFIQKTTYEKLKRPVFNRNLSFRR